MAKLICFTEAFRAGPFLTMSRSIKLKFFIVLFFPQLRRAGAQRMHGIVHGPEGCQLLGLAHCFWEISPCLRQGEALLTLSSR